ncbi:MAG: translation initiation factor IF-6 [Conexivisphaerales archaeon]
MIIELYVRGKSGLGLYVFDIYRNPNIGIFAKASDDYLLLPQGYARPKADKLASLINSKAVFTSIGYTRLLGPLVSLNNKGILVSRFASDEEIFNLKKQTGLNVQRFNSQYSSVGNLVSANDYGAIVSPLLNERDISQVKEVLQVQVCRISIAGMMQVGSILIASNKGSLVHPKANQDEINQISDMLKVDCEPGSVNGGVPYVASGLIVNSKGAIVGSQTVGPEMFIITKAFKL